MDRPVQNVVEYDFKHNGERLLHMLRQRHPDYHPIVSIAAIAHEAERDPEHIDTALRAHAIVLKYVEPDLKSVEVRVGDDRKRTINVSLFEEVLEIPQENPAKLMHAGSGVSVSVLDAELVESEVNPDRS